MIIPHKQAACAMREIDIRKWWTSPRLWIVVDNDAENFARVFQEFRSEQNGPAPWPLCPQIVTIAAGFCPRGAGKQDVSRGTGLLVLGVQLKCNLGRSVE
jgi:hypothetical protein